MGGTGRGDAAIQAFFPPTPRPSPKKSLQSSKSDAPAGDGFSAEEIAEALKPKPIEAWQPPGDYAEREISDLIPGPGAVTFMGRVGNVFDVNNTPKTPHSAKGCIKLLVKDDGGAITVRVWYATRKPQVRLGSLVSIWTNHISNGENGMLSSVRAPLFASLFPERDRSCHLMIHKHSDDGKLCSWPLGYREGRPLGGVMTLQNFIDGGYEVVDAKILVVVKSIGARKRVTRKDDSRTENVSLHIQDDTAQATIGLWGTSAYSPSGVSLQTEGVSDTEASHTNQAWKAGETVLLIEAPGWKTGRTTYLSLTASTIVDVNPSIPDSDWLRKWSLRQKSREAVNPEFPEGVFDYQAIKYGPVRCLYTLGELDEFARALPHDIFSGYLSVLITEVKMLDQWKRNMLLSGECCNIPLYANATMVKCRICDKEVTLRINPRVLGQVIDETASISPGKLVFSERAWRDLLGRGREDMLKLGHDEIKYLSDRLLFCRLTLMFGWSGNESKAGGRICVLAVLA